jgi:hypothetical protein
MTTNVNLLLALAAEKTQNLYLAERRAREVASVINNDLSEMSVRSAIRAIIVADMTKEIARTETRLAEGDYDAERSAYLRNATQQRIRDEAGRMLADFVRGFNDLTAQIDSMIVGAVTDLARTTAQVTKEVAL